MKSEELKQSLPRSLTAVEEALLRWLLENGSSDSRKYLSQCQDIKIISLCPCGCASFGFAANPGEKTGMTIISDYLWNDTDGKMAGIFAYGFGDKLGGIEVLTYEGDKAPSYLPSVNQLYPWEKQRGPNVR